MLNLEYNLKCHAHPILGTSTDILSNIVFFHAWYVPLAISFPNVKREFSGGYQLKMP